MIGMALRGGISSVAASHSLTLQTTVFLCCLPRGVPRSPECSPPEHAKSRIQAHEYIVEIHGRLWEFPWATPDAGYPRWLPAPHAFPMLEITAVTLASFAAGFVNSIAGGGGLVSIPVVFGAFPTAPAATLFGTNKLAGICGTILSATAYVRRVRLPWATILPAILAAIAGGGIGAIIVTRVPSDWLRKVLPLLLMAVLVQTLLQRNLGAVHSPHHAPRTETFLAAAIAFILGLYDGFFGPGTGSFLIFLLVRVLGFDFLHAAAASKLLNAATNLAAIAVFAATGNIWWHVALPMAVANVAGSVVGTHLALRHGSQFIRVVFAVAVTLLILKTGYDAYGFEAVTGLIWIFRGSR